MTIKDAALHSLHQFGAELTQADWDGHPLNPYVAEEKWWTLRGDAVEAGATNEEVAAAFTAGVNWEPFTD